MQDQKSIFGIACGLVALFFFWLWASGKYASFLAWAGAAPSGTGSVATGANASTTNGQTGAVAAASGGSSTSAVAEPNYVNTSPLASALAAIQASPAYSSALGGYTTNGAVGGGTQITPTVLANSSAVPATTPSLSSSNWLETLLSGGAIISYTSPTSVSDPTQQGQNGTLDPVTGLAQGGV
jgi:hypothetical protein